MVKNLCNFFDLYVNFNFIKKWIFTKVNLQKVRLLKVISRLWDIIGQSINSILLIIVNLKRNTWTIVVRNPYIPRSLHSAKSPQFPESSKIFTFLIIKFIFIVCPPPMCSSTLFSDPLSRSHFFVMYSVIVSFLPFKF